MKIALISHLFPTELQPHHGKFIQDHLFLLEETSSVDVELIIPTPYSIPFTQRSKKNCASLLAENTGIRLKYLSFPKKRFPGIIANTLSKSMKNYFHGKQFDVVHVHWLYPDALCIPQLKEMGFKCVLTIHGSDWYQTKNNQTLLKLFGKVLNKVDRILYSGPKLKLDIEKVFPHITSKSAVIFNFVDELKYNMVSESKKEELKKELGWNPKKIHALTVANIRAEKGVDILVNAIKESSGLQNVQFHIIGTVSADSYTLNIKKEIREASFQNIILHGPVPPDELIKYYQTADFFVQPSRREGFSVAILEALSCGLPVVCTNVGGNHLFINDSTGLMVYEPFDQNLEGQIINFLKHLDQYQRQQIRQQVISRYGAQPFKERLLNIYSDLSASAINRSQRGVHI